VTTAAEEAIAANPGWYHTIELAPGVVTPGQIDHRATAAKVLPSDLSGRRALDIGTFDGFWAFEMERRGANVVAIDVPALGDAEWPPINRERLEATAREWDLQLGRGFGIAAEALGSNVERIECPLQELGPEKIGGGVDFAFSGDILIHLRDPVGGLERIRETLNQDGELVLMEPVSLRRSMSKKPLAEFQPTSTLFNWWHPNVAAVSAWLQTAGFRNIERTALFRPKSVQRMRAWHVAFRART
jgi:hypothetical protein